MRGVACAEFDGGASAIELRYLVVQMYGPFNQMKLMHTGNVLSARFYVKTLAWLQFSIVLNGE